jgi:hypothetical protein
MNTESLAVLSAGHCRLPPRRGEFLQSRKLDHSSHRPVLAGRTHCRAALERPVTRRLRSFREAPCTASSVTASRQPQPGPDPQAERRQSRRGREHQHQCHAKRAEWREVELRLRLHAPHHGQGRARRHQRATHHEAEDRSHGKEDRDRADEGRPAQEAHHLARAARRRCPAQPGRRAGCTRRSSPGPSHTPRAEGGCGKVAVPQ